MLLQVNPYSAAESVLTNLVSSTVDFMALIAAILILLTIAGLGLIGFMALIQSLTGYSLVEWQSIRRIVGTLVTMGVVLGLLMTILPSVLSAVGLSSLANAINSFMGLVFKHLGDLV